MPSPLLFDDVDNFHHAVAGAPIVVGLHADNDLLAVRFLGEWLERIGNLCCHRVRVGTFWNSARERADELRAHDAGDADQLAHQFLIFGDFSVVGESKAAVAHDADDRNAVVAEELRDAQRFFGARVGRKMVAVRVRTQLHAVVAEFLCVFCDLFQRPVGTAELCC